MSLSSLVHVSVRLPRLFESPHAGLRRAPAGPADCSVDGLCQVGNLRISFTLEARLVQKFLTILQLRLHKVSRGEECPIPAGRKPGATSSGDGHKRYFASDQRACRHRSATQDILPVVPPMGLQHQAAAFVVSFYLMS